jgi:transposase
MGACCALSDAFAGKEAGQRTRRPREVLNGLRYIVKTGAPWRWMPNDLSPWEIVYQQAQRWMRASCLKLWWKDLRALLRLCSRIASGLDGGLALREPTIPAAPKAAAGRMTSTTTCCEPLRISGVTAARSMSMFNPFLFG